MDGASGLTAGCGFAAHILKAFLDFVPTLWRATIRTYVDDVTLSYVGKSARDVVRVLAKELPQLKASVPNRCMITNDATEQLYSPYQWSPQALAAHPSVLCWGSHQ